MTISGVALGTSTVTVTATDPGGKSATDAFTVTVSPVNQPPTVVNQIPDQAVTVGATTTVSIDGVFDDPDGENANLSYSVESSDDALATVTLSGTDLTIRGVAVGTPTVTVTAEDSAGDSVTDTFTVTVSPANQPPTVVNQIPDQAVTVGATTTVSIDGVFDDPDGENANLSYSVESSDDALATVTLSGTDLTIRGVAVGTPTVTVTAEDSAGDSVTDTFTVTVSPANQPPTVVNQIPDQAVTVGATTTVSIDGVFDDPDGENANLSYSVESSDDALATVTLSGTDLTIRGVAVGTPTVTVTAEDSAGDSVTDTFTVTVSPANQPPTVVNQIPDQAVTVGATTTVSIDGVFDDPDGENANLSYSVESSDDALATVTLSGTDLTIRGVAVGDADGDGDRRGFGGAIRSPTRSPRRSRRRTSRRRWTTRSRTRRSPWAPRPPCRSTASSTIRTAKTPI